jgi:hypothetical protein
MSEFKVKLNNSKQGLLDVNPSTQSQFSTSIQRTIFVQGPNKQYRKLFDGETFSDCNYWKKFAYPQLPYDEAFIEVLTDDGSVYSEVSSENNYPKVYNLTVEQGTDYSDNVVDIAGDTESYANFVQITNQGSSSVRVRINGLSGATFELGGSETQVFNAGDLLVTKLNFINNVSGGTAADVQVLCSIKSNCLS